MNFVDLMAKELEGAVGQLSEEDLKEVDEISKSMMKGVRAGVKTGNTALAALMISYVIFKDIKEKLEELENG